VPGLGGRHGGTGILTMLKARSSGVVNYLRATLAATPRLLALGGELYLKEDTYEISAVLATVI
jgi:hypothetical protein